MSGRYAGVLLQRISRACPFCQAPRTVLTETGGTVVVTSCSPYRCTHARRLALAAGPRAAAFEPAAMDDRRTSRARYPGSAA